MTVGDMKDRIAFFSDVFTSMNINLSLVKP